MYYVELNLAGLTCPARDPAKGNRPCGARIQQAEIFPNTADANASVVHSHCVARHCAHSKISEWSPLELADVAAAGLQSASKIALVSLTTQAVALLVNPDPTQSDCDNFDTALTTFANKHTTVDEKAWRAYVAFWAECEQVGWATDTEAGA